MTSRLVHRTRWFDVLRDSVHRPDGTPSEYDHVVTPGSVAVLAVDSADRVAVTRLWIYTHGTRQWRLPGGGIDPDDNSPQQAAGRELAEETGIRAGHWQHIGTVHSADSLTNHVEHVFRATELTPGEARLEGGESDLEVHWLPFPEVLELVTSGQMPHAGSSYAVLMEAVRRCGRSAS